jgi:hypothetical protein
MSQIKINGGHSRHRRPDRNQIRLWRRRTGRAADRGGDLQCDLRRHRQRIRAVPVDPQLLKA